MSQVKPDPQLSEISEKLSTLIQISLAGLLKDAKNQRERILLLSNAGLQPVRIAEILNTTRNTVNKELSVMKGGKKNGKKSMDGQDDVASDPTTDAPDGGDEQ